MSNSNKIPAIPHVDLSIPENIANILRPMKEALEIQTGLRNRGQALGAGVGFDGWKRKNVTLETLVVAGLITEAQAKDLFNKV